MRPIISGVRNCITNETRLTAMGLLLPSKKQKQANLCDVHEPALASFSAVIKNP
jgi:hypothetical protein